VQVYLSTAEVRDCGDGALRQIGHDLAERKAQRLVQYRAQGGIP
jgi:hypothetical protein